MNICGINESISSLRHLLAEEVDRIVTQTPKLASEVVAAQRLHALADAAPPMLLMLAGSYHADDSTFETLADCARIHLYARALDDLIDENLPVYHRHLLLAQEMFWGALGRLAINHSNIWPATTRLIRETVQAVLEDDTFISPAAWGRKNHHLLLIPMLLSGNSEKYRVCEGALSDCILIQQAVDELYQGRMQHVEKDFIEHLCSFLNSRKPAMLSESGWREIAERALHDAGVILNKIEKNQSKKEEKHRVIH